jgi:hypothetical protein
MTLLGLVLSTLNQTIAHLLGPIAAIGEPHATTVLNDYDQEIYSTDAELACLLDHVAHPRPNPWPITRYGPTQYQELRHVSLMIRGPKITPGVVDRPVRPFDVAGK